MKCEETNSTTLNKSENAELNSDVKSNYWLKEMLTFRVKGKRKEIAFTGIALGINFITGVAIVMSNKLLYVEYKLPPLFLTSFQFLCTFGGLLILTFAGIFEIKAVPVIKVIPLSLSFCIFVIFSNFSLKYNTVGTYQILKCLSDPCTFLLQVTIYGKVFSGKVKIALSWIVIGIVINYSTDIEFNLIGTLCGLTAVIATSLYYTWVGTLQEELSLSPMQLLFYQSSLSFVFLLLLVALFELPTLHFTEIFELHTAMVMMTSGLIALLINISVFYIINRTSVITYAVFCKIKICAVIIAAYILFDEKMTCGQSIGVIITLSGTMYYTYLRNKAVSKEVSTMVNERNNLIVNNQDSGV